MAISPACRPTLCSVCGEPLNTKGDCLACLLRTGLDESASENVPPAPFVFGDFEIVRREDGSHCELGRGAMGVTYLATDNVLRRKVALKVIEAPAAPSRRDSQVVRERFLREARAAAALRHPNIAAVFQFGASPDGSRCFYAMELLEGETLETRVRRNGPLEPKFAVEIAIQVTRALMVAAANGLIHRDLKPGNIMLVQGEADAELEVKVIDFGLAKALADGGGEMDLTRGRFVGTPNFASPEQFESKPVDVRSDIYSLGATLWFALTGKTPFAGGNIKELRSAHKSNALPIEQLKEARVPSRLRLLLKSMLATQPAARPGVKDLAAQLQRCSEEATGVQRSHLAVAATAILVLSLSAFFVFHSLRIHPTAAGSASTLVVPDKSIAVLPFDNLSDEKENAYFAAGVQDEITSNLAKIAELKVISRTSANLYKSGNPRNSREIGQQLGVAHLLEGSVQRIGNRLRVNAQLIDTRTDAHTWAQTYDRDVADLFAVQSEIAQVIAQQLHAKMSPAEKLAIERVPTADLTAFDLYARAKSLSPPAFFTNTGKKDLLEAVDLLNQAVSRDPAFFQAYCQLAWNHDVLYFLGYDRTPARLALAEAAIQAAFRLRPDAGEAHLARAENLYRGYLDYDDALTELEAARQTLPNDPRIFELMGLIQRRSGRWEQSTRNLEHAVDLDPRNVFTLLAIADSYRDLRRYAEAEAAYDRALAIDPNDLKTKAARAQVALDWKADTRPLHELVNAVRTTSPDAIAKIADSWLLCALAERDAAAAKDALMASGENTPLNNDVFRFNRPFVEGIIARMTKGEDKAQSAFSAARAEQEKIVQTQPNYGPSLIVLGLIDAALGRTEEALREGRRAVELLPVERDSIKGPLVIAYFAMIAAWLGDKDLACDQLATAIRYPGPLSYGELKLLPLWDPLHGDPRFEQIVNSLAPK